MRKLLAIALCSLPFALVQTAYAQSTGGASSSGTGTGTTTALKE